MNLLENSSIVCAKTMDGKGTGVSTIAPEREIIWTSNTAPGYEIPSTAIAEATDIVYFPRNSEIVAASDRKTGKGIWKHKNSNALVTNIFPLSNNKIVVTTMDRKVTLLHYKP